MATRHGAVAQGEIRRLMHATILRYFQRVGQRCDLLIPLTDRVPLDRYLTLQIMNERDFVLVRLPLVNVRGLGLIALGFRLRLMPIVIRVLLMDLLVMIDHEQGRADRGGSHDDVPRARSFIRESGTRNREGSANGSREGDGGDAT